MRKVINGKRYDTETAERVYGRDNDRFVDDFRHRSKDLYRTKSGAWFMHHMGGAMTDLAQPEAGGGTGMVGGEKIEPLGADDAYRFLAAHTDDDAAVAAIDRYFADRVTDA